MIKERKMIIVNEDIRVMNIFNEFNIRINSSSDE